MKHEAIFEKDLANNKLTVIRQFDASLGDVWDAWTNSELLDLWWAPKPYRAVTNTMDFRENGVWLYSMVGPEGDQSFCRVDFKTIEPQRSITSTDGFCDEHGTRTSDMPLMYWSKKFSETGGITTVTNIISFDKAGDLEKILSMGMQQGFTMALNNLDEYFAKAKATLKE